MGDVGDVSPMVFLSPAIRLPEQYTLIYPFSPAEKTVFNGGPTRTRTWDLPVMSRWLYQLSYGPLPNPEKYSPFSGQRQYHLLTKLFSFLLLLGWRSFLSALASICRIRSRVTSKS